MKFVVDANMPFGKQVFSMAGDVIVVPGSDISATHLKDADALLVRSVTQVNEELLSGSPVKFVGTATIGEDHIDKEYLAENKIGFTSAQGCNANSVSEWFTAAILHTADLLNMRLKNKTLGIVGVGNVGKRILEKALALGMKVIINDPPRQEVEGDSHIGDPLPKDISLPFSPLSELLKTADFVTVHVPLTRDGNHATNQMFDSEIFSKMKPTAVFINASRGDVVDEPALRDALDNKTIATALLDVWHNEPTISIPTLQRTMLATPHIAGYSYDGKINGTQMVFDACMRHFNLDYVWDKSDVPEPVFPQFSINVMKNESDENVLRRIIYAMYPILADDNRLRNEIFNTDNKSFVRLRKTYPIRREWHHTKINIGHSSDTLNKILQGLSFNISS